MRVIPFFLAGEGCPHRCLYCDQQRSSPGLAPPSPADVEAGLGAGLGPRPGQVAFYGGTFTLLPRPRQAALLAAVKPFLDQGLVAGLRVSTRPDALEEDELEFLARHGVDTIEIGAQSFDDRVLKATGRGHDAGVTRRAARAVKARGFKLGLQLLPGLPAEDAASLELTTRAALELAPDFVRIYPALVVRGTGLARFFAAGAYRPWTLEEAVERVALMYQRFVGRGIPVIRLGLMHQPGLEKEVLAGPLHPSLGHLVKCRVFFNGLGRALRECPPPEGRAAFAVPARRLSEALGHRRGHLSALARLFGLQSVEITPNQDLPLDVFSYQGGRWPIMPAEETI